MACNKEYNMYLAISILAVLLVAFVKGFSEETCDLKKNPEGCSQKLCSDSIPESCVNGDCVEGRCQCEPCWGGSQCDQKVNLHIPVFESTPDVVLPLQALHHSTWHTETVGFAMATDADDDVRCRKMECPCAEIVYSVYDQDGRESNILQIDDRGALYLGDPAEMVANPSDLYRLTVRASNRDNSAVFGETSLDVHVIDSLNDDGLQHRRFRRAIPDLETVNENNTIVFTFTPVSEAANGTELQAGIQVVFRLTMDVPMSTYAEDVKVELYAEEGNFTFGVLCPPSVTHVGTNIVYDVATPSYDFDADNPFLATAAYLNLGNLTNSGASVDDVESQIVIEFSMTILNDTDVGFSDTDLRWVTAGVEFANGMLIWVGQLGYYLQAADPPTNGPPTVTLNPVATINELDFGIFTLSMDVLDMKSDVTVKVFGSPNDVGATSICGLHLRSTGSAYCLFNDDVEASFTQDLTYNVNKEAAFSFGNIINGGPSVDSNIDMDIFVRLPIEGSVGTSYDVGVSLIVDDLVTNATQSFTSAASDPNPDNPTPGDFALISATPLENEVMAGGSIPVRTTIKIPSGRYDLSLEATITAVTPSVCRATVASSGYNLPCAASTCPYCAKDATATDGAIASLLTLGLIRNAGLGTDDGDDEMVVDVWVGVPSGTTPGTHSLQFELKQDATVLGTALSTDINVIATVPASQNGNAPTFVASATCDDNNDDLCTETNGATTKLTVTVELPEGSTFSDIKLEAVASLSPELLGTCDARVSRAGKDLGCFPYDTSSVPYTVSSEGGTSLKDKIVLNTAVVSNLANTSIDSDHSFDVEFLIRRVVVNAADVTATSTVTVYAYYNGGGSSVWNYALTVGGTADASGWDVPAMTYPVSAALTVADPVDALVAPGQLATVTVTLTFDKDTAYAYVVTAAVNQTTLNIMSFEGGGSDLPCGDPFYENATLDSFDGEKTNQKATLNLGVIGAAVTQSSSLDLTLVVMLSGDRGIVANGSEHWITITVDSITTTDLVTAHTSINANYAKSDPLTPVVPTTHEVDFATILGQDIEIGFTSSFIQTMTLAPGIPLGYDLGYSSTATWFEFTNIALNSVGEDVLALTDADLVPTYGLTASADLGFVYCPVGSSDCEVEFEVTVKVLDNSTAMHGDDVNVTSTVKVYTGSNQVSDDKLIQFFAINATVIKNYTSDFQLDCPTSISTMTPGQLETCDIVVNVTDVDVKTMVEVVTTLNSTYVGLTVQRVAVSFVGANVVSNLGSLEGLEATLTGSVNPDSTQRDRARLSLGTLSNAAPTYDVEDQIWIELVVQLTDDEEVVDGSEQILSSGVSMDSSLVWVSNLYIAASRDNTEQPSLAVTYNVTSDTSSLVVGDTVEYSVVVEHDATSSAWAYNLTLFMYLPPYIVYVDTTKNGAVSATSFNFTVDDSTGLQINLERLYFTDVLAFTVRSTISSDYTFKGKTTWTTVIPLQASYHMLFRTGNTAVADGEMLFGSVEETSYSFTTSATIISNNYIPTATCGAHVALGMEDETIQDCQITASSQPDPSAMAGDARLNGVGWKTEARAGDFLSDRYLKIDLGLKAALTGLETQGGARAAVAGVSPAFEGDIGKFEVLYSTDDIIYRTAQAQSGDHFFDHSEVYSDPPGANYYDQVATHTLKTPVEARYVIIRLLEYDYTGAGHLYNVLRTELYGCPLESLQPDVCQSYTIDLVEEFDRSALFDSTNNVAFVCDTKTHKASGLQRSLDGQTAVFNNKLPSRTCFHAYDSPTKWAALPDIVRNVIGYDEDTKTLFGIARDSTTPYFIRSTDNGRTWTPASSTEWSAAADRVDSTNFPLESQDGLSYVPFSLYAGVDQAYTQIGNLDVSTGAIGGLYHSGTKYADWDHCCHDDCHLSNTC